MHTNDQWTDSDAFSDALGEEIQLYRTPPTKHHRQKKHKSKHVHKTESSKSVPERDTLSIPEHDTFSDVLSQDFPSYLPGHSSGQRQQPSVERSPAQPVQTNSVSKSKRVLESHESGTNDIHSIGTVMRPERAWPLAVAPPSTSKKRKGRKSALSCTSRLFTVEITSHHMTSHDLPLVQSCTDLVSSQDQIFHVRPADLSKNRVWTLSL